MLNSISGMMSLSSNQIKWIDNFFNPTEEISSYKSDNLFAGNILDKETDDTFELSKDAQATAMPTETPKIHAVNNNNANKANNLADDGTDWTDLYVEGKGVNVYNLAQYMWAKKHNNYKTSYNDNIDDNLRTTLDSLKVDAGQNNLYYNSNKSKDLTAVLYEIAQFDTDHDGFLTEEELNNLKSYSACSRKVKKSYENTYQTEINSELVNSLTKEQKSVLQLGTREYQSGFHYKVTKTKVNGKDVVITLGCGAGAVYQAFTQEELDKLDKYLNDDNIKNYVGKGKTGKDLHEALSEITGIEQRVNSKNKKENNAYWGYFAYTNSAGMNTMMGVKDCPLCDEIFYYNYLLAKKAMEF